MKPFIFVALLLLMTGRAAFAFESEHECACEATIVCEGSDESGYFTSTGDTSKVCIKRLAKFPDSLIKCTKAKIDVNSVKYACNANDQSEGKTLNCGSGQGKRLCRIVEKFKTIFTGDCTSGCNSRLAQMKKLTESFDLWFRFMSSNDLKPAEGLTKLAKESVLAICRRNTFALTGSSPERQVWFSEMRDLAVRVQENLALLQAWGGVDFVEECPRVDFFVK